MKDKILFLVMLSISAFIAVGCTEMPPDTEDFSDLTISFTEYYGTPLIINGNGSVSHYIIGLNYNLKEGYLSQTEILELVEVFKENDFFSMKEQYDCGGCAYVMAPTKFTISFEQGDFQKNVTDIGRYAPEGFYNVVAELQKIRGNLTDAGMEAKDACNILKERFTRINVSDCLNAYTE